MSFTLHVEQPGFVYDNVNDMNTNRNSTKWTKWIPSQIHLADDLV